MEGFGGALRWGLGGVLRWGLGGVLGWEFGGGGVRVGVWGRGVRMGDLKGL